MPDTVRGDFGRRRNGLMVVVPVGPHRLVVAAATATALWTLRTLMRIVPSTTAGRDNNPTFRTIIRLSTFERSSRGLLSEGDQTRLDHLLAHDPDSGDVISGTGGLRKLRVPLTGRGKRGGARVIYYYHGARDRIYLVLAYPKNAKASLSGREKEQLRKLTAALEAEP